MGAGFCWGERWKNHVWWDCWGDDCRSRGRWDNGLKWQEVWGRGSCRQAYLNFCSRQDESRRDHGWFDNADSVIVSRNAQNAPPTLKDLKFWTAKKKKTRKIDRLARSLLIQGFPNDIYSLIERQMRGSEYGEQDRKAAILINDLKKCGYKKDNCELNYKFLNNLQSEWKQYGTLMRQTKNLLDINIDALYNILKQNQGDVNDALGYKKKAVVITSDPLALVAQKINVSKRKEKVVVSSNYEGSGADDFSELKKITALLAKAFNRRKFYSKPTNNNLRTSSTSQSANRKQEFVKSNDKKEDKKSDEKKKDMSKIKCYNCKKEGHFAKECKKAKVKDYNYHKTKMLLAKKDSDEQVLLAEDQAWMESSSDSDQEINANMVFMAQIEKVLSESDESSSSAKETIAEVAYYTSESESESEFENSEYYDNSTNYGLFVNNDDDQEIFYDAIESASKNFIENHINSQKDYDKSEFDHNDSEEKENLVDKLIRKFNHKIAKCQKRVEKANQQTKDFKRTKLAQMNVLQDQLKFKHVVIDTHIECQAKYAKLEEERYEYMIRYSALFDNDKHHQKQIANQEVSFDKMSVELQTSSLKPYVLNVILENIIIDLEDEVVSLLEKDKANLKTIESLKSKDLDTLSSVRRPKHSGVIWKKKGSSNTSNVDLSSVSHLKLNKNVNRYSHKDLLACNNSHLGETSSAYVCNDAMNVSCNSRMCDLFDDNNLFIFDDESFRISPVSKMPFRKKLCDYIIVHSKSKLNKYLPRTVHKWLPKLQPLAEPVAKWFPRVKHCPDFLWIINSGCSKHMTGNRALLTSFVEKFLGTVRFGNNDFAVIAGYGDLVISSMTIKKVYYLEGLGHNLFSVGQFYDKGLEVAFQKSTCFVGNENGVDLLIGDRSSNLYNIALNEFALNSSTCLLAKASSL
nr:integrase, catalytic region, zinc finger, CCHC-type, peptidase aspartic, catalytic [Tanacetum cinerariifolium]